MGVSNSPVMISGQPYRGVERPLKIPVVRIHLQQLDQSFRTEFGIETSLERVFRFFFVVQSTRQFAEDLPFCARLAI